MQLLSGLALATAALALSISSAHAGAWTQAKGSGIAILSGSYYQADQLYDNNGRKRSQPTYSKYEVSPYFEYGLWEGITAGANLSLQRAHQDRALSGRDTTNWGAGDSEFFLRTRLWQQDGFVISAEPMVKLPSPEPTRESPQLGGHHPDAGLGLSAGYGFKAWGLNHFADLDTQYRYRFADPKDQLKISATVGVSVSDKWMIMPQLFITQRMDKPRAAAFTQSSGDDYDLVKGELSVVYKMTGDVTLQAGAFHDIDGKNVGKGTGVLFALWKTF